MSIYRYKHVLLSVVLLCGMSASAAAQQPGLLPIPLSKPASVPGPLLEVFQNNLNAHRTHLHARLDLLMSTQDLFMAIKQYMDQADEPEKRIITEALQALWWPSTSGSGEGGGTQAPSDPVVGRGSTATGDPEQEEGETIGLMPVEDLIIIEDLLRVELPGLLYTSCRSTKVLTALDQEIQGLQQRLQTLPAEF